MPSPLRFVLALPVSVALVVGAVLVASAQDARSEGAAGIEYPAYLQAGTCEQPGEPVAALAGTSTSADDQPRTDIDAVIPTGPAIPAAVSVTEIDQALGDLLSGDLIVRVVESADAPDITVACGSIAGQPDDEDNLYLAVSPTNNSGVIGVVWLQGKDETTTVTVFLIPAGATPSPEASGQP